MQSVLTIGYEGCDIDSFVETLQLNKVDLVLDVREIPLSRKKGFSKNKFKEALAHVGIDYYHEKRLGSPKPMREKLYEDKDYSAFFKAFDSYLKTQSTVLKKLVRELDGNVALVCFEKDVMTCHRRSVARALGKLTEAKPKHLVVPAMEKLRVQTANKKNLHTC